MAASPESASQNDDAPVVGKGRATPTRAEREAARRRPLVADTKEARAAAKADLQRRREQARVGMANGEEKYLPPRDKGPQKRFVRDYVDAGWHLSEWVMALMVVVILLSLVPINAVAYWSFVGLWIYIIIAVGEMLILANTIKRKAAARFGGKEKLERGLGWYAAMRALQMRFMRMPKPQVKRRQYP